MPLSNMKKIQSEKVGSIVAPEELGFVGPQPVENRHLMIAQAAYYRALARGFQEGHADEDWYAAEAEIEQACGR